LQSDEKAGRFDNADEMRGRPERRAPETRAALRTACALVLIPWESPECQRNNPLKLRKAR